MTNFGHYVLSDENFTLLHNLPYEDLIRVQQVSSSSYDRISKLLKNPTFLSRFFNAVPQDSVLKAHNRFLNLVKNAFIYCVKIPSDNPQKFCFVGPHLLAQNDDLFAENKCVYLAPKFNTIVALQSQMGISDSIYCVNQDKNIILTNQNQQELFSLEKEQALPHKDGTDFYFPLQKSASIASAFLRFSSESKTITQHVRSLYSKIETQTALYCNEEKYSLIINHLLRIQSSKSSLNLTDRGVYLLRDLRNRNRFFNCLTKEKSDSERIWEMMPRANFSGATPLIFRNEAVFAITVPHAEEEVAGEASLYSWNFESPSKWQEEKIDISSFPPLSLEYNVVTENGFAIVATDKQRLSILLYDVEKRQTKNHPLPVPIGHTIEDILSFRPDGGHLVVTVKTSYLKEEELLFMKCSYMLTQMPLQKALFLGEGLYSEGRRMFHKNKQIHIVTYNEDVPLYLHI